MEKITGYYLDENNTLHTYIGDRKHITISDVFSEKDAENLIDELNGETDDNHEGEIFARKCDFTGQGMNEGWCFGDGTMYAKNESDAINYVISIGYSTLQEAYDDDIVYWTTWEDEDDYQYIVKDGQLIEIDNL